MLFKEIGNSAFWIYIRPLLWKFVFWSSKPLV